MRAALLCLFLLTAGAAAAEPATFEDLVAKAERGDADVDYTALRTSFTLSKHYVPYDSDATDLADAAYDALQAKDCATAMAKSQAALKINYLSIVAHFIRSDCMKELGDAAGSARELAIGRGIAKSLMTSGDGKSTATAYVVVTISEERFVINYLGFGEEEQSLINDHGHAYDLLTGHDEKTHEQRSAFFNIDALFAGMSKQMGLPSK